jgi:hypothetical protein
MTIDDSARPRHHPQTASRIFDGEAVIISPSQNMVRMLNPTGSRIWELADGSLTLAEIAVILTEEFEVTPEHALESVRAFVQDMIERQLLTLEKD